MQPASSEVTARSEARSSHVQETIEFVASLPAKDRIKVVQETYESAVIMAEGYNRELLRSESEMIAALRARGRRNAFVRSASLRNPNAEGARPAA